MDFWTLHEDHSAIPVKVPNWSTLMVSTLILDNPNWLIYTAIHSLANKYREDFKLPNLKIPFNNRHGFYFNIPQKDIQGKLPSKFIQVGKAICVHVYSDH